VKDIIKTKNNKKQDITSTIEENTKTENIQKIEDITDIDYSKQDGLVDMCDTKNDKNDNFSIRENTRKHKHLETTIDEIKSFLDL